MKHFLLSSVEVEWTTLHSQGLPKELQCHNDEKCGEADRGLSSEADLRALCFRPSHLEVTDYETTSSYKEDKRLVRARQ
jgi:hypothetical protein